MPQHAVEPEMEPLCHDSAGRASAHSLFDSPAQPFSFNVQVISMAADNVVKVWDLRNHRCVQTIIDADWPSQEDAHPTAMMYDPVK